MEGGSLKRWLEETLRDATVEDNFTKLSQSSTFTQIISDATAGFDPLLDRLPPPPPHVLFRRNTHERHSLVPDLFVLLPTPLSLSNQTIAWQFHKELEESRNRLAPRLQGTGLTMCYHKVVSHENRQLEVDLVPLQTPTLAPQPWACTDTASLWVHLCLLLLVNKGPGFRVQIDLINKGQKNTS